MDPNNMRGSRPTPARQPQATPQQVRPLAQQSGPQKTNKKKWLLPAVGVVIVLAIILGLLTWLRLVGPMTGVKADRYQAVFLTNDQVYFGKISSMNGDTITLQDVYYLKQQDSASDASKDTSTQKQVQLAKLGSGSEVHNPDNEMRINRTQVLFWENMKDDSQVVKTINQNR